MRSGHVGRIETGGPLETAGVYPIVARLAPLDRHKVYETEQLRRIATCLKH